MIKICHHNSKLPNFDLYYKLVNYCIALFLTMPQGLLEFDFGNKFSEIISFFKITLERPISQDFRISL